jgi:ABC-type branched-subunit amino acid transport system ATPase component
MNHISKINREFGVTVFIVEQKVREVLEVCHHVYSIKPDKSAYSGKPELIKTDEGS